MAKRVPASDKPYRPVDEALVRAVLVPPVPEHVEATKDWAQPDGERPGPDLSVGSNVVALPDRKPPQTAPAQASAPALKLSREKRVLLTPQEEREVERLVDRLAEELRTPVKLSHLLRACIAILCRSEQELLTKARLAPPLTRPPNGDPVALAQFEHEIAQVLSSALRVAPLFR